MKVKPCFVDHSNHEGLEHLLELVVEAQSLAPPETRAR
jgi:hypothetical protein